MAVFLCIVLVAAALTSTEANLIHTRQGSQHRYVAFSAGLTHDLVVEAYTTIAYDKVWIDTDNAYNSSTGIFTVPMHGMYTFIFHGLSQTSGRLMLDLYKNSVYQVTAYAHTIRDYAAASNSWTVECAKGDLIYIQGNGHNTLYGLPEEVYSTFSGFIIAPRT